MFSDDANDGACVVCSAQAIAVIDAFRGTVLNHLKLEATTSKTARCAVVSKHVILARGERMDAWSPQKASTYSWRSPERLSAVCAWRGWCFGGGESGAMHAWECWSGRLARCWNAHFKAVSAAAPLENHLATGGEDGFIHCWLMSKIIDDDNKAELSPAMTFDAHTLAVTSLEWSGGPYGRLASTSRDGGLKLWELVVTDPLIFSLTDKTGSPLTSVALELDESMLVAGAESGRIMSVNLNTAAIARAADAATQPAQQSSVPTCFDDDRGWVDAAAGPVPSLLRDFDQGHRAAVHALRFIAQSRLISASLDGSAKVWHNGQLERTIVLDNGPSLTDLCPLAPQYDAPPDLRLAPFFQRQHRPLNPNDTAPPALLALIDRLPDAADSGTDDTDPHQNAIAAQLHTQLDALREENDRWQAACDSLWHYAVHKYETQAQESLT